MYDAFLERMFNVLPHPQAEQYVVLYKLISHYNPSRIEDRIIHLVNSQQFDDETGLPSTIKKIYEISVTEILNELGIVTRSNEIQDLHLILRAMYRIENYLDSKVIIETLDSVDFVSDNTDILATLIEVVEGTLWITTKEILHTVTGILITRIKTHHETQLDLELDTGPENVMERRREEVKTFFDTFSDTATQRFISAGYLTIPSEIGASLDTMLSTIYSLENDDQVANEILAIATIAPITTASVPKQARQLIDRLYNDPSKATKLNLIIDQNLKRLGVNK